MIFAAPKDGFGAVLCKKQFFFPDFSEKSLDGACFLWHNISCRITNESVAQLDRATAF